MEAVTFHNARGLMLAAHLWDAPGEAGVAMIHGFCNDKSSNGRFDRLGAALQDAGITALAFDVSGCGASEDAPLSARAMSADLEAACDLLRARGKTRLGLFGNSLGGSICLKAALPDIAAVAASGAGTAPMAYDWGAHFEPHQLEELEQSGAITDPVESAWRRSVTIGAEMLLDFTEAERAPRLEAIACPVLLLYGGDADDGEEQTLLANARANLHRLPEGSSIDVVPGARHGLRTCWAEAVDRIVPWFAAHLAP
jgi:pimeloyl-ACP methyl ester carboxylesterase